jgi:uncharacterized membrane protein
MINFLDNLQMKMTKKLCLSYVKKHKYKKNKEHFASLIKLIQMISLPVSIAIQSWASKDPLAISITVAMWSLIFALEYWAYQKHKVEVIPQYTQLLEFVKNYPKGYEELKFLTESLWTKPELIKRRRSMIKLDFVLVVLFILFVLLPLFTFGLMTALKQFLWVYLLVSAILSNMYSYTAYVFDLEPRDKDKDKKKEEAKMTDLVAKRLRELIGSIKNPLPNPV